MKKERQRIKDAAWAIVADAKASRIERIEALKLVSAAMGILLPELDERWLTVRQVLDLRRAKQTLVERALKKKIVRQRQNKRARLRRKIRQLKAATATVTAPKGEEHGTAEAD